MSNHLHLLILFLTYFSAIKPNELTFTVGSPIEVHSRISLSQCVLEASKRFFTSDFETVTFSSPLEQVNANVKSSVLLSHLLLPILQKENRWTFLIKNLKLPVVNTRKYITKSYSYIVHIRKEGELTENIKGLKRFLTWNPHAKFLVMSPTVFPCAHKVAVKAIQALWEHNVINAAILLANKENTTKYDVYSWKPYSKYSCANNFSSTRFIDSCSFGVMEKNKSWFKQKIKNKAYNCSVKVNYVAWPPFVNDVEGNYQSSSYKKSQGIEINLLNMIAHVLNVQLEYTRSPYGSWGNIFPNGTATGDMKHLLRNEMDLVIGGYGNTYSRTLYFDCSRAYMQEPLVWCVPFEPIPNGFKNMITILSFEVWICFFLVFSTVTVLIWYISCWSRKESNTYKKLVNCFLNNFAIVLGSVIHIVPKTTMVRHTIAMFMIFSLFLNSVYTSFFTSIVSAPTYAQKYEDMEDIYRYNLKTYFVANSILFFQHYKGEKEIHDVPISLILERWRNCTNIPACLSETATHRNSAFCIPRLHEQYLAKHDAEIKKQISQVYCLKRSVVSIQVNLIMRKGFPLFQIFDDVLKKIISSGFIVKWVADNLEEEEKYIWDKDDYETVKIRFDNLVPVFQMLVFGYSLSGFIFLLEYVVYRKREISLMLASLGVGEWQYLN